MGIEKIWPAKSEDAGELLLFKNKLDRDTFLESERGAFKGFRGLEPRALMWWDSDAKREAMIRTPDGPKTTLTDAELAEVLARLKSYKHGDHAEKRDGATITVAKSAGKSRDYVAPGGFAPNYPLTIGTVATASFPSKLSTWKARLSDAALRPGSASITVRLTGDHLPPNTPDRWVAKKTAPNEWRITTGNSYVYNQEKDHDND